MDDPPERRPDRPSGSAHPSSSFVGRDDELATLFELFARQDVRLITVIGVPGVGKTRLAIEARDAAQHRLDLASVFVPLAAVSEAAGIPAAVAKAQGERPAFGDAPLIVLDNAEHLTGAAKHVTELLAESPGLTVLATSTVALGVPGEHLLRLGPLPHRAPSELEPAELFTQPSVRLFAERARAADARFALGAGNIDAVSELCTVLGGLPLAIELAAARVTAFPPATLVRGGVLDLLRTNSPDGPERHRSIRHALSWTYDLLPSGAQELLDELSVFAGSFSLPGVAAVTETPDSELGDLYDLLSTLVDARLVEPYPGDSRSARFGLVPLVRMFAREHLLARGRFDELQHRHSAYVQALADQAGRFFDEGELAASFALLELEWAEVTAALDVLLAADRLAEGLKLAVDCAPFLFAVGYDATARGRLERLIEAVSHLDEPDEPVLARALLWSALLARQTSDPALHAQWATQRLADGIALARKNDDARGLLLGLELTIASLPVTGDIAGAVAATSEGLSVAAERGDERCLARFEAFAAMIDHQRGDLASALEHGVRALTRAQRRDDSKATVLAALALLGLPAAQAGAPPLAVMPGIEQLLALCRDIRDRHAESYLLAANAARLAAAGDLVGAAESCIQHLALVRLLGGVDTIGPALSISTLVIIASERGEHESVARLHFGIERYLPALESAVTPEKLAAYRAGVERSRLALGTDGFEQLATPRTGRTARDTVQTAIDYARSVTVSRAAAAPPDTRESASPAQSLTPRELEVLRLLATGGTNKAIAAQLRLSPKTVMHYSGAIYRKLDVRGRAEATAWAYRNELIGPV